MKTSGYFSSRSSKVKRLSLFFLGVPVLLLVVQLIVVQLILPASYGVAEAASKKLILSGSSTMAPLVSELAKKFEKNHPGIRIDVQTGGSSRGIADAKSGLAAIGMSSRALKPKERNLNSFTIAYDGIAPLVHKSNPINNLTKQQFKGVLLGTITNWKDLGGSNMPIVVANRAQGRSELDLVCDFLEIRPSDIKARLVVGENSHGIKTISRNKRAITYLSVGHALKEIELGVPVKVVGLAGVKASFLNVSNGRYPLARPLILVTEKVPVGAQKDFIDYVRSKNAAKDISSQNFVPFVPFVPLAN